MLKQTKVFTEDLELGMYVAQLDRPWVETPFMFQGFHIQSPKDILELKKHCEFVLVDKEQSTVHIKPKRTAGMKAMENSIANKFNTNFTKLDGPKSINEFRDQLKTSIKIHENTKKFISHAMHDIRLGKNVDVKEAKKLVGQLAQNVVANPTTMVWLTQLKNKDEYTSLHSLNVCILSLFFGRSIGLSELQLRTLGLGALLHDIGKLRVPSEVLTKPSRLTNEEFDIMRKHTLFGYDLMKNNGELNGDALDIIVQHHERLNGTGYPNSLEDGQINRYAKLVAIVDVYDAVTSKRVYHDETTPFNALNDIYAHRDKEFEPHLVEQFIKCLGIYPIGSLVELNTGQVGVVVYFAEKHHLAPTVMLVLDENKTPYDTFHYVNLGSPMWEKHTVRPEVKRIVDPGEFSLDLPEIVFKESLHMAFGWQ